MDADALTTIKQTLTAYRRKNVALRLFERIAKTAALCLGMCTVVQVLFALIPLTVLPIIWDGSLLLFALAAAVVFARRCIFLVPPLIAIADAIEKERLLSPRWLSLSLELQSPDAPGSGQLKNEVASRASAWLARAGAPKPARFSRRTALTLAAAAIAWSAATAFVKPRCGAFWDMPLSMGSPVSAAISPGSVTLPMRSSVRLRCIPRRSSYPSCGIALKDIGAGREQSRMLRPDTAGAFHFDCDSLVRSLSYQFSIGMTAFPPETVRIAPPPSLYGIQIRVTPPAYAGQPALLLGEGQGNFTALPGSKARFSVNTLSPLADAFFCPSHGDTVRCATKGADASVDIVVRQACGYTFSLVDTFGQKSDSTPAFFIDVAPDAPPSIRFIKPALNKELSPALSETLCVEARDDIGISQCSFHWRKNSEPPGRAHARGLLSGNAAQTFIHREMAWDLRELSLYPGDTVFYWAYCRDNDPFDTTHYRRTDTFWLRLLSFDEIHERLTQQQQATDGTLQSARLQEDRIKGALGSLLESTKGKESLTWEQKQILSDLKESFKAQSDTLTKAIASLGRTVEQLKQQGLSSRNLLDKMDKVQKALEDIARRYGDSALFEPPRTDETLGMEDLKNALEKFRKTLPDLARQLDNALKYLEMLKRDQELAQLARRAREYGKEQMDIASDPRTAADAFVRQKALLDKMDTFLSELRQQSKSEGDKAPLLSPDMSALQPSQTELQAMQGDLNGNRFPPNESMQRMAGDMFSLSQDLLDMQSSAGLRKLKKEQEALMELSHDALNMAAWQKELAEEQARRPSRRQAAKAEQSLKLALAKSAQRLDSFSLAPPQTLRSLMSRYSEAAASMDKSLAALQNEQEAAGAMEEGQQSLNGLAYSLLQASGSLDGEGQRGQGGAMGEMMAGFQRLSGKQAMINCATGNILRQMLGGQGVGAEGGKESGEVREGQGSQHAEKARREAQAAQKAVADALQKLSETYGKQAGSGMDTKAKDLEQEARRLATMLENPQPEVQDRQQRFLSRMLQTTLSMHKQDEGKEERQSQSAKNPMPTDIQKSSDGAFDDRDFFFRIREKAFSGNFPESYREAVRAYFDTLGTMFLKEK